MSNGVKILLVGPKECGKTYLANFLADATEISSGTYRPTKGVRILEFEVQDIRSKNGTFNAAVELWDCSGDDKFEICWPSMQKNAAGILFVYNPGEATHLKELQKWHLHFAKEQKISESQCVIFAHQKPGYTGEVNVGGSFPGIQAVESNLDEDPNTVRKYFKSFLRNVVIYDNARREKEELSIIQ